MMRHHLVKFGGYGALSRRDMLFLCHTITCHRIFKELYDLTGGIPPLILTTLSSLVAISPVEVEILKLPI